MTTIVACVDFSAVTGPLIEATAALARGLRAQVHVVHAIEETAVPVNPAFGPAQACLPSPALPTAGLGDRLEALAADLRHRGVNAAARLMAAGGVAALPGECARLGADLIVVGSHGHTALHDLLVGGAVHRLLRRAACPVVVVPSPGKEARPAAAV